MIDLGTGQIINTNDAEGANVLFDNLDGVKFVPYSMMEPNTVVVCKPGNESIKFEVYDTFARELNP